MEYDSGLGDEFESAPLSGTHVVLGCVNRGIEEGREFACGDEVKLGLDSVVVVGGVAVVFF